MKKSFLLAGLLLLFFNSQGKDLIVFSDTMSNRYIGKGTFILEDKDRTLSLEDVIQRHRAFKKTEYDVPNLGVSTSHFWIRFSVVNKSRDELIMLELAYPLMDEVVLYEPLGDKRFAVHKTGDSYQFASRKYNHQNYIFDLRIPPNTTRTYYLRLKSGEQLLVPLSIISPQKLAESLIMSDTVSGIQFGILLVMILYNLFIYFTVKDKSYLYYVNYILFFGLMQATLQGYAFKYLWPSFPWFANQCVIITPSLGGFFAIEFLKHFLQTKTNVPRLHRILPFFVVLYGIAICLSLAGFNTLSYKVIDVNALLLSLFILNIAYQITLKRYRPAYFFLSAWAILLLGVTIFTLRNFGILSFNNFTNYIIQIGSALEVIFLSFALADRITILKKEKEASQFQVIEALEENKRLITHQNVVLEKKVAQRTSELENAYRDLQEAESQLVNSEKMASLGQLTAGIAHEINNPINFVVSNISPLKRDLQDLQELLQKYESIVEGDDLSSKLKEINRFRKEIDIDFTKQEIEMLLRGIAEGASRTAEIVKSLKNFSRVDESDLKMANINEGVLSTVILLNQQLEGLELEKNLGEIPEIECYPGKLNQVFMNIITNGIQILESHPIENRKGKISITTYKDGETIVIKIKDNGKGMTEEVKSKIFDPFFTTKDVGKGTGLGLSISYGIIEKHKGTLVVNSAPNEGAEFVITLPIKIDFFAS